MEFRQLKYFLAIADHGSLSSAAARLYVAQSALSQQVAQLEKDLGTKLLHRSSTGVSLTETGKVFYGHAQAIMRQLTDLRFAVKETSESPTGVVILGIPQSASAAIALPLLMAARRELPRVTLQLSEELTGNIIEQLRQGRMSLAILFDDGQLKEFATKHILKEKMFFIKALKDGESNATGRITFAEVLQAPLILPSVQHGIRMHIERLAIDNGTTVSNLVAEINSINILKSAVLAGLGGTILSRAPFGNELGQKLMIAHEIHGPAIFRTIAICASRSLPTTLATHAVSRLIVQVVRDVCKAGQWPDAEPIYHHCTNPVPSPRVYSGPQQYRPTVS